MKAKFIILLGALAFIITYHYFNMSQYLTLAYLKENHAAFREYYAQNQVFTLGVYSLIYIVSTAVSIPGAAVLTLTGGALFGLFMGTIIVSIAATIGATLAFLIARHLLKDWVQEQFGDKLASINIGMEKEGAFYLFTLRLIPIFPFFVINLAMGLTPIKTKTYYWVSQVGMLPATFVYVNAGTQLSKLESLKGILSLDLLLSFALLGIFPLIGKKFVAILKERTVYKGTNRPAKFDYNMVVIGAGAAGLVTSYISAALKAKVALIEKDKMGGDCLNTGCVPSKALLRSAKMLHYAKRARDYGFEGMEVNYDFAEVMERVQRVIKKIEPHDSVERYSKLGVDCIQGSAEIISPWEVKVNGKILTTRNITIATGASPFVPPIPGIDKVSPLTSKTLWDIRELPGRFVVLGGGPIGAEMAQAFARLGSKVTIVEILDRIMAIEDPVVSDVITEKFNKEGIEVLTGHSAKEFGVENGEKYLIAGYHGKEIKVEFDEILVAAGRKANITGLGLEKLGVETRKNGTIEANEFMQTKYPNIYVCGDVTGPFQLTHIASHQAWFCAVNGLFGKFKKFKADYRVIPWCTYTDPEAATVGLNEQTAKKQNQTYELTEYGIEDLDRAIADGEDHGMVRVLTKPGTDKILGATIVGTNASDLILEFIAAMKHGFGLNKIMGTIHIYPTMGEANKYLAGNWKKKQTSELIFNWLKWLHAWNRG